MQGFLSLIIVGVVFIMPFAAWVTHIVVCIQAAAWTGSAIALLIAGIFIFPVGILHGFSVWLGFNWV